jgi:hypothetical protein
MQDLIENKVKQDKILIIRELIGDTLMKRAPGQRSCPDVSTVAVFDT